MGAKVSIIVLMRKVTTVATQRSQLSQLHTPCFKLHRLFLVLCSILFRHAGQHSLQRSLYWRIRSVYDLTFDAGVIETYLDMLFSNDARAQLLHGLVPERSINATIVMQILPVARFVEVLTLYLDRHERRAVHQIYNPPK